MGAIKNVHQKFYFMNKNKTDTEELMKSNHRYVELIALSLNDIINMNGIGAETLRLLVSKLNGLGIDYYPLNTNNHAT